MIQKEFVGGDLRVRWQENPTNVGVIEYQIIYQCDTDKVVHTVRASEFQSEDVIQVILDPVKGPEDVEVLSYADTLTFAENMAAGLTRNVIITIKVRGADGLYAGEPEWLVVDAENPPPDAPHVTFKAQQEILTINITPPDAPDIVGYVVHRGTEANFVPSGTKAGEGTCVASGPDTSFSTLIPAGEGYFYRIGAKDRFGPNDLEYATIGPITVASTSFEDLLENVDGKLAASEAELLAQLASEKAIREAAINGLNSQLTVIDGKITLTNPEAGSIGSRFLETESQSNSHSQRISGMETVVGLTDEGGLRARIIDAETTIADLESQKASSTRVSSLETEVAAAREGEASLKANLDKMDQTIVDGLAEKASSSSVNSLTTEIQNARGGSANLKSRIDTVQQSVVDGLALKASSTELSTLSNEIVAAREGQPDLKAQLASMRQTVVDGLALKASTTTVDSLSNEITNARDGSATLGAKLSAMQQTVTDGLALKASTTDMTTLQSSVSVRNRTFRQNGAPTNPMNGYPLVTGDTWINTTAGQNNALSVWTGTWTLATDPRIAAANQGVTDINAKIGTVSGTIADALTGKAEASTVASLDVKVNGFDGRITTANTIAASADGRVKAISGVVQDVNGYATGWTSENTGTSSAFKIRSDKFEVSAPGGGARTEFSSGAWKIYDAAGRKRIHLGLL